MSYENRLYLAAALTIFAVAVALAIWCWSTSRKYTPEHEKDAKTFFNALHGYLNPPPDQREAHELGRSLKEAVFEFCYVISLPKHDPGTLDQVTARLAQALYGLDYSLSWSEVRSVFQTFESHRGQVLPVALWISIPSNANPFADAMSDQSAELDADVR